MGNIKSFIKNIRETRRLQKCNVDTTPVFSLDGITCKVKVINVYDGDTIWVIMSINGKYYKNKIRMAGYDSAELKPLKSFSVEQRNIEIGTALVAKSALESKIANKIVTLKCGKFDKYGRLLGTVFDKNININEWMIASGHGWKYNGGNKESARCILQK
jgi:endonuclease YncB( thermonuclease family)